jgi:hypothetical protein
LFLGLFFIFLCFSIFVRGFLLLRVTRSIIVGLSFFSWLYISIYCQWIHYYCDLHCKFSLFLFFDCLWDFFVFLRVLIICV